MLPMMHFPPKSAVTGGATNAAPSAAGGSAPAAPAAADNSASAAAEASQAAFEKDLCVCFVHGMTGTAATSYFAEVWAEILTKQDIGFLFMNNRGHTQACDIRTESGDTVMGGTMYEIFEDCLYDIDLLIKKAKELGYKRIILAGHSLGCNKSIYYYSKRHPELAGMILASAPDMFQYHSDATPTEVRARLMQEAQDYMAKGEPYHLLSDFVDQWMPFSARTYVNWYTPGSSLDNIPVVSGKGDWSQLASVDVPILTFSGGDEEDQYHRMDEIGEHATSCPRFEYYIIPHTDHGYHHQEGYAGAVILDWIRRVIL